MDNRSEMLQLCRLCLVKDDVNIPIFEEQGDIRKIFLKISSCLPVKVSREDKLPKKICDGCSYKLDMLYEFWNTTANAEKQLLSWLGEAGMNSKMTDDTISAVAQQIKPTETFVKQEAIDPSDIHTEVNDDDKSYMFQQKFTVEEAGPSATVTSNEEEPPLKRARRTAAVKAQIAMDPESDDDDDSGEPMTKMEDESEDSDGEDREPTFVDVPSTSADDQPGPSGVGKDGVEAPFGVTRKKVERDGLMCYVCLIKYPTAEELKDHVHKLPEVFYCTRCNGYFDSTHSCSKSNILCAFCKKPIKGINVSKHKCFHISTMDDLKKLKEAEHKNCSFCGIKISEEEIDSHYRICPMKLSDTRTKTSETCSTILHDHREEHRSSHTKEHKTSEVRNYNCNTCGIKFDMRKAYRRHRYQFHDIQFQVCFMCGKSVRKLNQHIKAVHGDPNDVKCPLCDKTFSCKKHLYRHKLVHSNEFKHKCTTCGKGFKTPFSLRVHKRSHDAVKPFECTVCLKTFTTKQWRDNHLKTH